MPHQPTPTQSVAIVGDGQMGLVLASILATSPAPVAITLWGHDPDEISRLAQTRRSPRLSGVELPDSIRVTDNPAEALASASMLVNAVPTQFIRSVWTRLASHCPHGAPVVSVAKGIENDTLLRPLQVITDVLRDDPDRAARPMLVLSGPTIAAELARCLPATMIAASDNTLLAGAVQQLFTTSWLRIYTSDDPLGVEVAGAMKNVIAIAAGIIDGLQAGYNAKSALLARGLSEIVRLGAAMGARTETFFGLAGVGDLATTCFSPEGRNRSLGEALGKGETLDAYLKRTNSVVEGVATTRSVVQLAQRFNVDLPITAAVHAVLFEQLDPIDAIAQLMNRPPREEAVG
ncbi:MAG: NAD(P)-dependent glycerol-3-phosphate dehydrogenase [Phycisphaerales bacterium]|nr:NAD(P)-dependent glycerol-3-phosphate dehydrogenase [Phycisphaerales bacterium]